MATLESGFNPTYSENASILTGNPNRVTVEVEDTVDKDFWSNLLNELCPEKDFHFDPYHTILNSDGSSERKGKGKSQILRASTDFNAWHIGCLDSDYDWILSDYTGDGKIINGNKYLLQTYVYSIENLMCLSSTLAEFCNEVTEEKVTFDFVDHLNRLSKIVYPLLIWSAYLYRSGNHYFTPTDWREILVNTEKDSETALLQIISKAETRIDELNMCFTDETSNRDELKNSLIRDKELTEENAYLYVRGHDLFDHLLNSVLNPVISQLRSEHYNNLRSSEMDEDSRVTALQEYSRKDNSVKNLLQKNYRYKNACIIYDKIQQDIMQIWK